MKHLRTLLLIIPLLVISGCGEITYTPISLTDQKICSDQWKKPVVENGIVKCQRLECYIKNAIVTKAVTTTNGIMRQTEDGTWRVNVVGYFNSKGECIYE